MEQVRVGVIGLGMGFRMPGRWRPGGSRERGLALYAI